MEILTKTIKELINNGHSQDEILNLCDKLYDMTDQVTKFTIC